MTESSLQKCLTASLQSIVQTAVKDVKNDEAVNSLSLLSCLLPVKLLGQITYPLCFLLWLPSLSSAPCDLTLTPTTIKYQMLWIQLWLFFCLFYFQLEDNYFSILWWSGFPGGTSDKEKNLQETYEMLFWSLGWEDPLEEVLATHSSIHASSVDGGAWWATVHRVTRSGTQVRDLACTHTVLVSAIRQLESAMGIHMSPPTALRLFHVTSASLGEVAASLCEAPSFLQLFISSTSFLKTALSLVLVLPRAPFASLFPSHSKLCLDSQPRSFLSLMLRRILTQTL